MANAGGEQPIIIKKKKAGGHGAHGGAWKIAYADLVTAMMAFFLVMWIIGLDEKTKVGIAEYFNNPSSFGMNKPSSRHVLDMGKQPVTADGQMDKNEEPEANLDLEAARRLEATLDSQVRSNPGIGDHRRQVTIAKDKDGLRIELADSGGASFFTADGRLRPEGAQALAIASNQIINAKSRILIEGHHDPVPGSSGKALALSSARAQAVAEALVGLGYPAERILQVIGVGANRLKFPANPSTPANRRVVIVIPYQLKTDKEATFGPS